MTVQSLPQSSNPYLTGNLAPVDVETTAFDLEVTGRIPTELNGRYLRNGPNPMNEIDPDNYHWFIGDGMVHGIRLRDGKAEWYRNRWVRSDSVAKALGESAPPSDWPADHANFAANTNVIGHAGKTYAIVEAGGPPIELGFELDTIRASSLGGTLPQSFSAHPKRDPKTGELHVMAYWFGWGNHIQYLVVDKSGKVRRTVDIPLPGSPMVHDIAFTKKYVLVFDLPCLFNLELAMSGVRFPFRWDDQYQARIGLLPREGSADDIKWCAIDPCYIFHPMNAFDAADGKVVLNAVRHNKMFASETRGPNEGAPTLDQWILNPANGSATHVNLDDRPMEFPRIDERLIGINNRFGYGAGVRGDFIQDVLVKHDLTSATSEVRDDGKDFGYGEPVFVPRFENAAEDEGWIMALRHNLETNLSELVIIDSQAFTDEPVAIVHLPVRVPNGFHGNWIPLNQ
ncbi:MAG: carotenoid oxygenase family protein [Ilumatobacteraceae bacterium]